jgi:hypothetical protein
LLEVQNTLIIDELIKPKVVLDFNYVQSIFKDATPEGIQVLRDHLDILYTELKEYYGEGFGPADSFYKSLDTWLYLYQIEQKDSILETAVLSFLAFMKFYIQRKEETDPELP